MQLATNVYDATKGYRARRDMSRLYPPVVEVGDIVLVECIALRVDDIGGFRVEFVAYQMSVLWSVSGIRSSSRLDRLDYLQFPYVL